jgi:16S rRNA processing protein RimM
MVSIGFICRAWGIKGELLVEPLTDNPKRFSRLKKVYIVVSGKNQTFDIQSSRVFKKRILLKLIGIDTPEEAKKLVNCYLEIEKKDVPALPKGEYYIFDIVGLKVKTTEGENLGEIKEVIKYPSNDVYVVSHKGKQYDLPAIKEIIKKIDLKEGVMVVQPLPGLWD